MNASMMGIVNVHTSHLAHVTLVCLFPPVSVQEQAPADAELGATGMAVPPKAPEGIVCQWIKHIAGSVQTPVQSSTPSQRTAGPDTNR